MNNKLREEEEDNFESEDSEDEEETDSKNYREQVILKDFAKGFEVSCSSSTINFKELFSYAKELRDDFKGKTSKNGGSYLG